uniref:LRRCT domain-containing protein n=1 Tax=Graphocephala atropunctata TaxID=36148 RepID=A0A1B6MPX2_9HEMI
MEMWLVAVMLVLVAGGRVAGCPEGCFCSLNQGLYEANCSSLPYSGGKVEALTVLPSRDHPQELSDGQFYSARHLKYLSLRNCSIYFIHKKAFYGAKNVIEIDLSFNYIEELEPTVFQHLTSLATLSLRGNPIQFLSDMPFLISNSLQNLDIGECKIRSISRGVFYGLKRLKYLSLDGNSLKSLKYNTLPKGLKYLNLSHNHMVNIPTEVLSSLTNLRRIGLSGNPINCTCSLMNLQDWLSGRGVIFEDNVTCAYPPEYYGIRLSKVDENRLCLAEARREELFHSAKYNRLLSKQNYFRNENSYLRENVQSDQPQSDSQAEVLFQNDETVAMGEMMRDEEDKTDDSETELTDPEKEITLEAEENSGKSDTPEVEPVEPEEPSPDNPAQEDKHENLEVDNLNSPIDEVQDNKPDEVDHLAEEHNVEDTESLDNTVDQVAPLPSNLSESSPVEFKPIDEEVNTEVDDFRQEGLFHVDSDKYTMSSNDTIEESTIIPDIEETTEVEIEPTLEAEVTDVEGSENLEEVPLQNSTSSSEISNGTVTDDLDITEEEDSVDLVPTPAFIPDLLSKKELEESTRIQVHLDDTEPTVSPTPDTETNQTLIAGSSNIVEEKIKDVAGAEVVMFCIAVLVICLILYSIYKCRTKSKRQTVRINKDVESNRGTEMQDMASLLPKPQEDEQRNGSKYPDKAPSSETVKLIGGEKETEAPRYKPVSETTNKIDDKNSLNNNTPSSPTAKTPLIKPGNPITINPAAPIQRTKVRVGVIPDSIPRTPIFVQKSLNGTKNI